MEYNTAARMKSAAHLLLASIATLASVGLLACSGDAGEDGNPVVVTDSGATDETSADAEETGEDTATSEDTAPEDTGADAGKLTCTGSENEPNDTRVTAAKLKDINDCDSSGGTLKGIVAGGADTDWFTYTGSDTFACRTDVVASTKSGVRLCVIASCKNGATAFKSCAKGLKTTVAGLEGCCSGPGGTSADVELEHSCTLAGTSDDAEVYMRVDDPSGTTCKAYTVTYHF